MNPPLFAQDGQAASLAGRLAQWAISGGGQVAAGCLLLAVGVWLLLPPRGRQWQFWCGAVLTAGAAAWLLLPSLGRLSPIVAFALLEILVVLGALGTISSRSPVYSAIWFAVTLLGVGSVLLLCGAQFLAVATVAVYAGAIVVTFLFVLMLAQPSGSAFYDRIGWGWFPALCASVAGAALLGIVTVRVMEWEDPLPAIIDETNRQLAELPSEPEDAAGASAIRLRAAQMSTDAAGQPRLRVELASPVPADAAEGQEARIAGLIREAAGTRINAGWEIEITQPDVLDKNHVARFGGQMFSRHLVAVQVVGILLLVALVGAVAIGTTANAPPATERTAGR
jgi:NADH-quinone oxidoreductase subunit J